MNMIKEIKEQAIKRIVQLKYTYGDDHIQERIELVKSLGTKPVYVVSYRLGTLDYDKLGKWDNDTRWTISTDPEQEGWETDSGCSGYGLYPEVAQYYAMCINEYPALLSKLELAEKALEKVSEQFEDIDHSARWDDRDITAERIKEASSDVNEALKAIRE